MLMRDCDPQFVRVRHNCWNNEYPIHQGTCYFNLVFSGRSTVSHWTNAIPFLDNLTINVARSDKGVLLGSENITNSLGGDVFNL